MIFWFFICPPVVHEALEIREIGLFCSVLFSQYLEECLAQVGAQYVFDK